MPSSSVECGREFTVYIEFELGTPRRTRVALRRFLSRCATVRNMWELPRVRKLVRRDLHRRLLLLRSTQPIALHGSSTSR
jgi:hypothetical protein